jgi:CheY-like chemotaxis protein
MKKIDSKVPPSRRSSPPAGKERILYVEDEVENWDAALLHLEARYQLHRAATDEEACAFVRANADRLFAVLMDIQLKGSALNGVELTRAMRVPEGGAHLPPYARDLPVVKVPIFFVTAYAGVYSEASLTQAGGNGIITKPVDFVKLMRVLTTLHLRGLAGQA